MVSNVISSASNAQAPALQIQGLCKSFGGQRVLSEINLDIRESETVVLIGPSGSGKTTLLRCVNFLETPDDGTIALYGHPLGGSFAGFGGSWRTTTERELAKQRLNFGFVFQRFNLFPHLTAIENVAIGPRKVRGLSKQDARALAERELNRVHLSEHLHKRPAQLSGGQQQRVAIARALAMEPRIMLFDEPTSALDPELVYEVLDAIRELAAAGMTMMIVTHEMGFARETAHRVVFMANGRIVEEGASSQIFTSPREDATRRFFRHIRRAESSHELM